MKRIVTIILAFISFIALCSCDGNVALDTTDNDTKQIEEILIPEHQELSILCNDTTKSYVEFLATSFMNQYSDVTVNIIYVEGVQSSDYTSKLSSMLLSNDGPDIVMLGNFSFTQNDISILKSDVLLDINVLNQKYDYLDWSDYEQNIIDAGIFDGQRKIMPIFYEIPSLLIGISETLEKENIAYGQGVTFEEFTNSTTSFDGLVFRKYIFANYMYRNLGLNVIDQYSAEADLDNEQFEKFIMVYDNLFPDIYNGKFSSYSIRGNFTNQYADPLLSQQILFTNAGSNEHAFSHISFLDSNLKDITDAGKTPIITTIPNMDGSDEVAGTLGWCMGINSLTKSEEACLRFIDYAISFDAYATDTVIRGIPVNKAYNEAIKSLYYGEEIIIPEDSTLNQLPFSITAVDKCLLDQYYEILSNVEVKNYVDSQALMYVEQVVVDISKNGSPIEDAIRKQENALTLYMNE